MKLAKGEQLEQRPVQEQARNQDKIEHNGIRGMKMRKKSV